MHCWPPHHARNNHAWFTQIFRQQVGIPFLLYISRYVNLICFNWPYLHLLASFSGIFLVSSTNDVLNFQDQPLSVWDSLTIQYCFFLLAEQKGEGNGVEEDMHQWREWWVRVGILTKLPRCIAAHSQGHSWMSPVTPPTSSPRCCHLGFHKIYFWVP